MASTVQEIYQVLYKNFSFQMQNTFQNEDQRNEARSEGGKKKKSIRNNNVFT